MSTKSQKHHALLQVRMEVQLGKRCDKDAKRLAAATSGAIFRQSSGLFGSPYAHGLCQGLCTPSSKADRNGL